ncbi:hypothetical protein ACIGNX_21190 [Actinosynnema sp. NPDC053489]|uniref:hypothetical protein n=1 Tax=Actinosynnema sp. NPDC053489 TaxID=3363916 RepID=UPI0037CA5F0D
MTGGRDDGDPSATRNDLDAGHVRNAVLAGRIGRLVLNHPPQLYLALVTGAALALAGAVTWAALAGGGSTPDPVAAVTTTTTAAAERPTITRPTTTTAEPPPAEPAPTEPSPTEPAPTTTAPKPPRPRPTPAPVEVLWQGTVKVRGDGGPGSGWFFDQPPPREGSSLGDLAYGDATTVTSDKVADLPDDAVPDQARCAELLNATAGITRASSRVGNAFCFTTRGGRVGHAVVTGTSPRDPLDPSTTLDVVVWDLAR